ncbi:MAG: hypothetical protein QME58_11285 [Bacteroidota bacterium]|nr:hypothetical protein [Bacteroidota bacterium]
MSTNQTLLTIGALILFSTLIVSFYQLLARSGDTVDSAQLGIYQLTLATTYMELANGLNFDEATIDSNITAANMNLLTHPNLLGPENPPPAYEDPETSFSTFDDIDDLNNFSIIEGSNPGIIGTYKTTFKVYYVNPDNINQIELSNRTFVKRLDLFVSRIQPLSTDTLKTSMVMGYFHFD